MSKYKSVVTTLGQAHIASALQGGNKVDIISLAVGDGNGAATTPSASQTTLVNEQYRLALNSLKIDDMHVNRIVAEAIVPSSVGGFWLREMGLFASNGDLIAVANMADTYKPTLAEGSGRTQTLRIVISVTDTQAVSLSIDDSIIVATESFVKHQLAAHENSRNHPDGSLTAKGFLQLNSAVDSSCEQQAATPRAVKTANDNANTRVPNTRNINSKTLDKDITLTADDVGALPLTGGTLSGDVAMNGAGFINKKGNIDGGNKTYITNGFRLTGRTDDLYADVYQWESMGDYQALTFRVSNGKDNAYYEFRNSGAFRINGPNPLLAVGGANFYNNGDINGTAWGGNLSGWLQNQINRLQADAQNRANVVQNFRFGEYMWLTAINKDQRMAPAGYFVVGARNNGTSNLAGLGLCVAPLQFQVNGTWITVCQG